ncbi:MAG: tRNA 2-thiouridine(34) synthase MnmA [Desulfobacterota bacterium]|nr:tRNA 2-thiouridine(34) synthase MnmA [Thermodesulfobacteriota bacterium]
MMVAIAMSGGVDSSVAAALLKEQGYRVIGITMIAVPALHHAAARAAYIARSLGIDHITVDCHELFHQRVIAPFCAAYRCGKTPNPCVRCNDAVKFGFLRDYAERCGAALFATGHYARIERDGKRNTFRLVPGIDSRKDQSYFLYRLDHVRLARIILPLGMMTKEQVKQYARSMALPVLYDRESQDICFLSGMDYGAFVAQHAPGSALPGPIVNCAGEVLGTHRGIIHYTVGQRRGIGIAAGEPLYVVALDPGRNAVIVGSKKDLYRKECTAGEVVWIDGSVPHTPLRVLAKIRSLHQAAMAWVVPHETTQVNVRFDAPQMSITPGQSIVFYDPASGCVLGGGIIEELPQDR